MKKIGKIFLSICLFFIIFLSMPFSKASADIGPKPASYITIKGIEGDYVAAFASTKRSGPNGFYEDWLERGDYLDYHPIMEYNDNEGYKWLQLYMKCNGEEEIQFTYWCPEVYKIIIYKDNEIYAATKPLEMYAYSTYYELDFSKYVKGNADTIKVRNSYNYFGEIAFLLLRIVLTLVVEIGLFFLMRLYTKRNLLVVGITNLVTQIILNVMVNIDAFNHGWLSGLLLLFLGEAIVLIVEFIVYQIFIKDKNRLLIILYPIIANLLSFGLGLLLLVH